MNANLFEKANRIVQKCDVAYIGVIDENGFPSVSTASPIRPKNIVEAYFSTGIGVNKTKRILENKKVSICYHMGGDNITLVGEAELLTDQETKSKMWLDCFKDHFDGGETDPGYCIIKFTTKRVSLWVDCESAEFTIDELLKVSSCCGLLCDWCEYKKSNNCGGCIQTNGNPFHGECPIAKCCQDKGYSHCGECENIPSECENSSCDKIDSNGFFECSGCKSTSCDKLYPYSYKDPDHGDNPAGSRVEICKAWSTY